MTLSAPHAPPGSKAPEQNVSRSEKPIIQPRGLGTWKSVVLQPDTHGCPGKHGRQLWVRYGGSDNTRVGQPRRTFILRGRKPIPRCCDQHPVFGRHTEWNAGCPVERISEITWEPDRTFVAWGVKGPWGVPGREALTVTLRSPRAPAGGPLLEPERPGWVAAAGANLFRKEGRDRSDIMLICPQPADESYTNVSSACWMPRHWRQRSCSSSADKKTLQPRGHGQNGTLKRCEPSVICSFRICSFSWSAQGNRWREGLHWLHRDANQEQIKYKRVLWRSSHLSYSQLWSKNRMSGCTCRLLYSYVQGVEQVCKIPS